MTDDGTDFGSIPDDRQPDGIDDAPEVSCSRCGRTWDLEYELDDLQAGNRAIEQFALDHHRHTGHFPDGLTPWLADCRNCPDEESFLSERPTRRWAKTHARHTGHAVECLAPEAEEPEIVERPEQ